MSEDSQEPDVLVCFRPDDPRRKRGLSTEISTCSVCGAAVSISPACSRFAASNPNLKVICSVCFDPGKEFEFGIVPGAKEELEAYFRRN
jgi:hypothetical protein